MPKHLSCHSHCTTTLSLPFLLPSKHYSVVYNSESGSAWKAPLLLLCRRARFPSPSVPLYAGNSKQLLINLHHWIYLVTPGDTWSQPGNNLATHGHWLATAGYTWQQQATPSSQHAGLNYILLRGATYEIWISRPFFSQTLANWAGSWDKCSWPPATTESFVEIRSAETSLLGDWWCLANSRKCPF